MRIVASPFISHGSVNGGQEMEPGLKTRSESMN